MITDDHLCFLNFGCSPQKPTKWATEPTFWPHLLVFENVSISKSITHTQILTPYIKFNLVLIVKNVVVVLVCILVRALPCFE